MKGPILPIDQDGGIGIVGIEKRQVILSKQGRKENVNAKCGRVMTYQVVDQLRRAAEKMGADPFLLSSK